MIHSEMANRLIAGLNEIFEVCGYIQDAGACDGCPLRLNCIDDTSVAEFADTVSRKTVTEFLGYADDVENYSREQEYHDWMDSQKEYDLWQDSIR